MAAALPTPLAVDIIILFVVMGTGRTESSPQIRGYTCTISTDLSGPIGNGYLQGSESVPQHQRKQFQSYVLTHIASYGRIDGSSYFQTAMKTVSHSAKRSNDIHYHLLLLLNLLPGFEKADADGQECARTTNRRRCVSETQVTDCTFADAGFHVDIGILRLAMQYPGLSLLGGIG
jgi:hypothetical protein